MNIELTPQQVAQVRKESRIDCANHPEIMSKMLFDRTNLPKEECNLLADIATECDLFNRRSFPFLAADRNTTRANAVSAAACALRSLPPMPPAAAPIDIFTNKISAIKEIRTAFGLGLLEAKYVVELAQLFVSVPGNERVPPSNERIAQAFAAFKAILNYHE